MVTKILLSASLSIFCLLQADYITTYQMDDETQTIMYHDATHAKIINSSKDDNSAIYSINKKIYMLSTENGKTTVVDMDQMRSMMGAFGEGAQRQEKPEKPDFKITKTGKKETVAGIKGEVWIIEGNEDGEHFKDKIVVTKDKRVIKTTNAMMHLFSNMSGGATEDTGSIFELEKGYATIKADGLVLKSFKEKKLPKSEYELPKDAQIQEMQNIAAL